jgi:hypothetical protein
MRITNEKIILAIGLFLLLGVVLWNHVFVSYADTFWWYDMVLHFFGGVMVAMILLYSAEKWPEFIQLPGNRFMRFVVAVSFVALIGVLWEFYEYALDYVFRSFDLQLPDTLSDLFFDLFGASCVAAAEALLKRDLIN